MEYLGIVQSEPTPLYKDNTAVIALVKANKITNHLRYIDIPLCYMHNEYNLQTFTIGYYKSKVMLSNFLTKPLLATILTRESGFAMGHMHLSNISEAHY